MNWNLYSVKEIQSKWEDWDRLNGLYYNHHPYFDSRFIKACLHCFGDDSVLLAELRCDANDISGMLLIQKDGRGTWELFHAAQMQIIPILLNPENKGVELKTLLEKLPGFKWRLISHYQDLQYTPFVVDGNDRVSCFYHCTTTAIELNKSFEQFWNNRKKKLQQNIKRYLNRLKRDKVRLSYKELSSLHEIKQGLIRYGLMESNGWKGKRGTAIHPDNIQGRFYDSVLHSFGMSQQATIHELYIDEQLAASRICISNLDMNIMLKVTYNEELKKYSPGRLLTFLVLEKAFEEKKYKSIEFYTNAGKDQIEWASSIRDIYHFEIYKLGLYKKIIQLKNRK